MKKIPFGSDLSVLDVLPPCVGEQVIDKRHHPRIQEKDLAALLDMEAVQVELSADQEMSADQLLNISLGGIAVTMPTAPTLGHHLRVSIILGRKKITVDAIVRQVRRAGELFVAGLMFVDLVREAAAYLNGLVSILTFFDSQEIDPASDAYPLKFVL